MPAYEIMVTYDHISRGRPRDPFRCPVALAIVDAVGAYHARVRSNGYVYVKIPALRRYGFEAYRLPKAAREFVKGYDDGTLAIVAPFSFTLDTGA